MTGFGVEPIKLPKSYHPLLYYCGQIASNISILTPQQSHELYDKYIYLYLKLVTYQEKQKSTAV